MNREKFTVTINAPREKVWNALWDDASYRYWTTAFCEGSHAVTDWQKGSKVLFLDGNKTGMVSRVADRRDNEFMSFEHLGEVRDGVEDTTSERVKAWVGGHENYTLLPRNGQTELVIDIDLTEEFKDYFMTTWPKALARLKELAEQ